MVTLTVTKRKQVTLREDVLRHLGVRPGDEIELAMLPDGRALLQKAARPTGTIDDFIGRVAGKTKKPLTIEDITRLPPLAGPAVPDNARTESFKWLRMSFGRWTRNLRETRKASF
jgi:antitoxin PrlF